MVIVKFFLKLFKVADVIDSFVEATRVIASVSSGYRSTKLFTAWGAAGWLFAFATTKKKGGGKPE